MLTAAQIGEIKELAESTSPIEDVYIYQADLWCADDGEAIREDLTERGLAPEDPDDEESYDSDDFPKGPYGDGGGEADTVQHCAAGEECLNAITLPDGHKIGAWLGNPLTNEGAHHVCQSLQENGEVAWLWATWYADDLALDACEIPGVSLTLTYGEIPDLATFERHFDHHVPEGHYSIQLSRSDAEAAEGTSIGDGDYGARELYRGLEELVEKWDGGEDDAAGDLASGIMETLGFEWV